MIILPKKIKLAIAIIGVCFVLGGTIHSAPPANAFLGIGDVVAIDLNYEFHYILDAFGRAIAKEILNKLNQALLDIVRTKGECAGPGSVRGCPSFVTNWQNLNRHAQDSGAKDARNLIGLALNGTSGSSNKATACPHIKDSLGGILGETTPKDSFASTTRNYRLNQDVSFEQQFKCTLPKTVKVNGEDISLVEAIKKGTISDVDFLKLLEPQNTSLGFLIGGISEIEKQRNASAEREKNDALAGQGFKGILDKNGKIVTPGAILSQVAAATITSEQDCLLNAQYFEDYVDCAVNMAVNRLSNLAGSYDTQAEKIAAETPEKNTVQDMKYADCIKFCVNIVQEVKSYCELDTKTQATINSTSSDGTTTKVEFEGSSALNNAKCDAAFSECMQKICPKGPASGEEPGGIVNGENPFQCRFKFDSQPASKDISFIAQGPVNGLNSHDAFYGSSFKISAEEKKFYGTVDVSFDAKAGSMPINNIFNFSAHERNNFYNGFEMGITPDLARTRFDNNAYAGGPNFFDRNPTQWTPGANYRIETHYVASTNTLSAKITNKDTGKVVGDFSIAGALASQDISPPAGSFDLIFGGTDWVYSNIGVHATPGGPYGAGMPGKCGLPGGTPM